MSDYRSALQIEILNAKDAFARWHVIRAAGATRDISAVDDLLAVLESPAPDLGDTDERAIAAWALGRIGLAAFLGRIPKEGDRYGRSSLHRAGIVAALGETRAPDAVDPLVAILKSDGDRDVWLNGTLALAKTGETALPRIMELSTNVPLEHRLLLLDAIHKIGGDVGQEHFSMLLKTLDKEELRLSADFLTRYMATK